MGQVQKDITNVKNDVFLTVDKLMQVGDAKQGNENFKTKVTLIDKLNQKYNQVIQNTLNYEDSVETLTKKLGNLNQKLQTFSKLQIAQAT